MNAAALLPVAVHGVPRSGTSWLGEILNSSPHTRYCFQPLFSYALQGFLDAEASAACIEAFWQRLATLDDDFVGQRAARAAGRLPDFAKGRCTHLVYKEVRYHHILPNLLARAPRTRLVAIVRHPLATLASWFDAPREFRADLGWQPLEEWRDAPRKNAGRPEEYNGYARWKEAALLFHALAAAHPGRVCLVEYAALCAAPARETERIFAFLGLEPQAQTARFLQASRGEHHADAYSVFRARADDDGWRGRLPPAIVAAVADDLRGSALEGYLRFSAADWRRLATGRAPTPS